MNSDWKSAIQYLGGSPEEEQKIINKLVSEFSQAIKAGAVHTAGQSRKPQHTKMIAAINNARLIVADDLPEDLQIGFLKPAKEYPVVIRYSNASTSISRDDKNDLRGIAIRITPDTGMEQDFLMTNAELHHAKNAYEAMQTSLALYRQGSMARLKGILRLLRTVGLKTTLRIVKTLSGQSKIPVESLATESFYSRSPLRILDTAVKYRLKPILKKTVPDHSNEDLTKEFYNRLHSDDILYELQVQRFLDETSTPLENSACIWPSEYKTIALLLIPKQKSSIQENLNVESIHFNPFQCNCPEIEPIGNMNRLRKYIYLPGPGTKNQSV